MAAWIHHSEEMALEGDWRFFYPMPPDVVDSYRMNASYGTFVWGGDLLSNTKSEAGAR